MLAAIAVLFALTLCSSVAIAQSGAGSIQGTVTDSTGAVIPGASSTLSTRPQEWRSTPKQTTPAFTRCRNYYGDICGYDLGEGHENTDQTIELLVSQNAVVNATLTTGAVTQQVTVSANTVQL